MRARLVLLSAIVLDATIARAQHCQNVLVTVRPDDTQIQTTGLVASPAVSGDGRIVAFFSSHPDEVAGGASTYQLYARDVLAHSTELISVGTAGEPGSGSFRYASISADGRYVAFDSTASNLVSGDPGGWNVFVRDRALGATTMISRALGGGAPNGSSAHPSISADGRYVAFSSTASNLVASDSNGFEDVFVFDRTTGVVQIASVDANGVPSDGASNRPSISANGRFVAFSSGAQIWAPSGVAAVVDVFVKDLQTGALVFCSLSTAGDYANSNSQDPVVSADGSRVVFASEASNLVVEDGLPHISDVFLRDVSAGTTTRLSATNADPLTGGNGASIHPSISADGRWVAFETSATNLGDAHGTGTNLYLRDLAAGTAELVSRSADATPGNDSSTRPALSSDGRCVAFQSTASNLTNDFNDTEDVLEFRRDCLPQLTSSFCSGDGSGAACPCGNFGTGGNGCASSINPFGANLSHSGSPVVSVDTFVLHGSGLSNSIVTYFQGTARVNGGAGAVFGDGLRCAGGTIVRLGAVLTSGGASQYPNAGDPSIAVRGAIPPSGGTRTYQCWYRNSAVFCTAATWNLTNGIEASWAP